MECKELKSRNLKISKRTALNYLEQAQRENPVFKYWADEAAGRLKSVASARRAKGSSGRRQEFRYGKKKRANR